MKRAILITAALTLLAGQAMASKCDPDSVILDAIFFHGSIVCNPAWLDRPAPLSVLQMARNCRDLSGRSRREYLERGNDDFDRNVTAMGHDAACKKLDALMRRMEGATK